MRALLDVNVLVALHDPLHIHHQAALEWLDTHRSHGWASCPITQNGCARVMSQPSYSSRRLMTELWPVLTASFSSPFHVFWPDDISLFDVGRLKAAHVHGHRQLTDLYLLALAVHHGGRFVSFDARVPLSAVPGAKAQHMHVLFAGA
jgi:toxin-antitoxin system PIN domain toxin